MRIRPSSSPDHLGVVRDRPVPADVVARTDLDDVVALGHPPSAAQHDVMLVAGMACGRRRARPRPPVTSTIETSRLSTAVDVLDAAETRRASTGRSAARTTTGCGHLVHEEPGGRDVQRVARSTRGS